MRLTEKQQLTLNFIASYWTKNGYSPSIAEIRDNLGLAANSNNTIIFRLESLASYGLITRSNRVARSIKLTDLGRKNIPEITDSRINANETSVQNSQIIVTNFNTYGEDQL